MKKVANEKIYKWKGMKDYEKIHKWKIYSFGERMPSRTVSNWNPPMPRGRLLLREILHKWKFSTNDNDDWWNRIRIYICEIIHKCKFFLFSFVKFFTNEKMKDCEIFHNVSTPKCKNFHKTLWKKSQWKRLLKALAILSQPKFTDGSKIARYFVKNLTK